jgi:hypothetical protein
LAVQLQQHLLAAGLAGEAGLQSLPASSVRHNRFAYLFIRQDLPVPVSPKEITFILSMRLLDSLRATAALATFIALVNQMTGHHYQALATHAAPKLNYMLR